MPLGMRVSSAMEGKFKPIHGVWIPEIHAGMTNLERINHVIWQSRIKNQLKEIQISANENNSEPQKIKPDAKEK